jgi:hypothetical protein
LFLRHLASGAKIGLVSGITHTLFNKVEIYNQGKLLRTYDNFARLYWLVTLISRPAGYFNTVGGCNGDIMDYMKPEGPLVYTKANQGALERQAKTAESGKPTFFNRLWIPCFQTDKLIPTKLQNLQIHLYLNDERFGKNISHFCPILKFKTKRDLFLSDSDARKVWEHPQNEQGSPSHDQIKLNPAAPLQSGSEIAQLQL